MSTEATGGVLRRGAPIVGLVGFGSCVGIGIVNQLGYALRNNRDLLGSRITLALAVLILVAGIVAALGRTLNTWHYAAAITTFGVTISPVMSALVHGEQVLPKSVAIALALTGAVLCAGAAKPGVVRAIAFWVLVAVVWLSLALACKNLLFGGNLAFRSHYGPRHTEFLHVPVLSGITGHQNTLGFICAVALPAQWALIRGADSRSAAQKMWARIALLAVGPLATAVALIWTQSKTALVAAVIGMIVVCLPLTRLTGRAWAIAWGGFLAVLTLAPLAIGLAGITSFTGRVEMWRYALDDFRANPIFGYGMGFMTGQKYWSTKPTFPDLFGAHNQLLDVMGRTGLFGAIWLVTFVALLAVIAWRARGFDAYVAAGLVTVFVLTATQETIIPLSVTAGPGLREVFIPMTLMVGLVAASVTLMSDAVLATPMGAVTDPRLPAQSRPA
ncbi:MAG: O-antigen ligase family protein [Actinomycetes bacterium]